MDVGDPSNFERLAWLFRDRDLRAVGIEARAFDDGPIRSGIRRAFEAGADDYLVKPFGQIELAARLRGRLRRQESVGNASPPVRRGDLEFDPVTGRAALAGAAVELYPTERELLRVFLAHPDRPLSRDFLWESVRGCQVRASGKALTVQLSNLRRKLGAWGKRIETWRGAGYLFNTRFPPL